MTAEPLEPPDAAVEADAPPVEIKELSEACRQYVLGAVGVELDYTPETLSLLDHYIVQARASLEARPELHELLTRSAGAYFGEVVRRAFGGFWRIPSPDAHDWQVCLRGVFLAINPVGVAWDALEDTNEHMGPSSELVLDPGDRESVHERLEAMPKVTEDEFWLLTTRLEVLEAVAEHLGAVMVQAGVQDVSFEPADYDIAPRAIGQA